LHTDDTPHTIALGAGIATFVAFLPLVGLQMFISVGLAALARANKAICIPIVWITNPFTMGPIYYGCYELGHFIVPATWAGNDEGLSRLFEVAKTASLLDKTFWKEIFWALTGAGMDLWIGCFVVSTILGVIAYCVVRSSVIGYRERRRQRLLRRTMFRASRVDTGAIGPTAV